MEGKILIIWAILIPLAGIIAGIKGRSVIIHSLLTLIMPLWFFCILFVDSFKTCSECGRKVKSNIMRCVCGYRF